MSDMSMAGERQTDRLALGALAAGVAALLLFVIAGFTTDALFLIGIVLALIAVPLGWLTRGRTRPGERSRTMATVGLVAGAVVLVWFIVFLIVSAFD